MKGKLIASKKMGLSLLLAAGVLLLTGACSKNNDSNEAAKFIGSYTGTATCLGPTTVVVTASGNASIQVPATIGGAPCAKQVPVTLNVAGNNITSSTQTFSDNCGTLFTLTISGSVNGNTLTLNYNETGAGATVTCTFIGTK